MTATRVPVFHTPVGFRRDESGEIVLFEEAEQAPAMDAWLDMVEMHPATQQAGACVIIGPTKTSYLDMPTRTAVESDTADGAWKPTATSDNAGAIAAAIHVPPPRVSPQTTPFVYADGLISTPWQATRRSLDAGQMAVVNTVAETAARLPIQRTRPGADSVSVTWISSDGTVIDQMQVPLTWWRCRLARYVVMQVGR